MAFNDKLEWIKLKKEVGKGSELDYPANDRSWNPEVRRADATRDNTDGGLGDSWLTFKNVEAGFSDGGYWPSGRIVGPEVIFNSARNSLRQGRIDREVWSLDPAEPAEDASFSWKVTTPVTTDSESTVFVLPTAQLAQRIVSHLAEYWERANGKPVSV